MGQCGEDRSGSCEDAGHRGADGSRSREDAGQCGEERNRSCEDAGPCGEYGSRSREEMGQCGEERNRSCEEMGYRGEYGSRSHENVGQCGEDRSGPCGNGGLEFRVPHDIFLCAMAAEEGAFFHMDEELAHHRRHDSNTAAEEHRVGKLLQRERKLWEIEKYLRMLGEFEERRVLRTEAGKRILREKTRAMEGRYEALQSGRIWRVLRAAARDWRQVRAVAVVCDLMIVRGGSREGFKDSGYLK